MATILGFQASNRSFRTWRLAGRKVDGSCARWAVPRTITSFCLPFAGPFKALGSKIPLGSWALTLAAHIVVATNRPIIRFKICHSFRDEVDDRLAAQRIQQATQVVVIELVHEFEQLAQFAAREALACEPAEVVAGEFRDFLAFVFTVRHFADEE